jgi:hypothetical protein
MNEKKLKNLLVAAVITLVSLYVCPVFAAIEWETNLTVNIDAADTRLSFGQKEDATDGIDGKYDVPAMLSGDIKAYFSDKEGSFWRDIKKSASSQKRWSMRVESLLKNRDVSIKWNQDGFPHQGTIKIKDVKSGIVTDMRKASSYSYQNSEGTRDFIIEVKD